MNEYKDIIESVHQTIENLKLKEYATVFDVHKDTFDFLERMSKNSELIKSINKYQEFISINNFEIDRLINNIPMIESQVGFLKNIEKKYNGLYSFKETFGIYFGTLEYISDNFKTNYNVVNQINSSVISYGKFIDKKFKRKEEVNYEKDIEIVDYATDILVENIECIGMQFEQNQFIDEKSVEKSVESNLFQQINIHAAFLYKKEVELFEIGNELDKSIPIQISKCGMIICDYFMKINECCIRNRKNNIFKPTNKIFYSCAVIPSLIATNEVEFANIIDGLYFSIYEGSGYANRLTAIATDEELRILWFIKKLRNSFRHDLEHGEDKKIIKNMGEIGDIYRELIKKVIPIKPIDWKIAQLNLYKKIILMLEMVIEKLNI